MHTKRQRHIGNSDRKVHKTVNERRPKTIKSLICLIEMDKLYIEITNT